MSTATIRRGGLVLAALAVAALAACSRSVPAPPPPPPPAYEDQAPPPLAGGPRTAPMPGRVETRPEWPGPAEADWMRRHRWSPAPRDRLIVHHRANGTTVVTMRPIPNPPRHWRARHHPRWRHPAHHHRHRVAHPGHVRRTSLESARPPGRPVFLAMPALDPQPIRPDPAALTAALGPELQTVMLSVDADGRASLALPATLPATLQAEAARLGLGKAAQQASISAALAGDGYDIVPNGEQTARLLPGAPLTFTWRVRTGPGHGPVTASLSAVLLGDGVPRTVALGQLSAEVPAAAAAPQAARTQALATAVQAAPAPAASESARGLRMPDLSRLKLPDLGAFRLQQLRIPGYPTVEVPGVRSVPSEQLMTGAVLLLIVLLLTAIARRAARRRARESRRKRFRTFEAGAFGSPFDAPGAGEGPLQTGT